MIKCLSIKVSGKVQGVFFRASTKEYADELGIKGFVRNESDNTVYIEAESTEELLAKFTTWCTQGPTLARVDHCDVKEISVQGFTEFVISR